MNQINIHHLKERSALLMKHFVYAGMAGLVVLALFWLAMSQGFRAASIVAAVAFALVCLYAFIVWFQLVGVRLQLRQTTQQDT